MIPLFDAGRQYRAIKDKIDKAVIDCLDGGWYILGKRLEAFESEFAAYIGAKHAIGVGNGTEAIRLALEAAGVRKGDGVVTTPNTAIPTVVAIIEAGCRPYFADIDERTWNIDPDKLESVLREHKEVKAVVPVHLYGRPVRMAEIGIVANTRGIIVIEDCAQAHGAKIDGRCVGTFGAASAFSFYPSKNLGAMGDAGLVTTDDNEIAARLRLLRHYGQSGRYEAAICGINSRLDELQAAILSVKLKHLHDWTRRRRKIATRYDAAFRALPLRLPDDLPGTEAVYHLYVVRTPERERFMEHLQSRGVGCQTHYPIPLHLQPAFKFLGYRRGDFPERERHADEVVSLPLFPEMTEEEIGQVIEAVASFFPREM